MVSVVLCWGLLEIKGRLIRGFGSICTYMVMTVIVDKAYIDFMFMFILPLAIGK